MEKKGSALIIGGGVAGIQASLDLADRGLAVYLVEKTPSIGGRMAQLDKTFPTLDCSICILAPKMIEVSRQPNVKILTNSEVQEVSGEAGKFHVKVLKKARFVDENKCVGCGICATKCPIKCPDEFNMGLSERRAIYVPFAQAVPRIYTIDRERCLYFTKGVCRICEKFCEAKAINFDLKDETVELEVASIIVATGFDLYDPSVITEYGYRRYKNVLIALEFERMVSSTGPTSGKIIKLSDGGHPNTITFIQCVGSRSLSEGYPYCSSVCCMFATKEAILVKEHEPKIDVHIFYTDLMVFGKGFQEFVNRASREWRIKYFPSTKPGEIREDPKTRKLFFRYENKDGEIKEFETDLVVLCNALTPRSDSRKLADTLGVEVDEYGFFKTPNPPAAPVETTRHGIFVCGCCQEPMDIPDAVTRASSAAAKASEIVTSAVLKEVFK